MNSNYVIAVEHISLQFIYIAIQGNPFNLKLLNIQMIRSCIML